MKTLVVYYSFEGNCGLIAEALKASLGPETETLEIKTVDEKKREGFSKYLWGGTQVFMKKKPALKPYTFNAAPWDLIILGAPVWAGAPAPAMAAFLGAVNLRDKKTAVFCCHAGGKGAALEKFTALLGGSIVLGQIDFQNPRKQEKAEVFKRAADWVKTLRQ